MTEHRVPSSTPDLTEQNIERLKQLFPEILTDGEKIDFDKLKLILGGEVDEGQERYNFTWHGKRETMRGAQIPSKGTLKVDIESSKNFDTTENLYIEGDNLEVLKILQKSYNSKVKMIFIDPPYNTGQDFVYKDNFKKSLDNYLEQTNQMDSEGNSLQSNTESSGRFHTDWLNMIYPRLKLSRNLLSDDGAIFITIDDNEHSNLKKICDEIFGERNFLGNLIWKHTLQSKNDERFFSRHFNNILIYSKNIKMVERFRLERTKEDNKNYSNPDNDPKGRWRAGDVRSPNPRPTMMYSIQAPNGNIIQPPTNGWRWSKETLQEKIRNGEIIFRENNEGIIRKIYLCNQEGRTPENIWNGKDVGTTRQANSELKSLFNDKVYFDTPKPTKLVQKLMNLFNKNKKNYIVMDFFSGSATTAHSTLQLNAEDGGNRKFIMVQLPEETDEKSEAYKDGFKNICDIGKERIRRAGDKILEEHPEAVEHLDIGFKVLKLDQSNIREWKADFEKLEDELNLFADVFVPDAKELDIVYEIMLKTGLELTLPINTFQVNGKNVYEIAFGNLFICLDDNINREIAQSIIEKRQEYDIETSTVVFKDAGFANNDSEKLNCFELLKDAGYQDDQLMTI